MHKESEEFLFNLLATASPSGVETAASSVWRKEAEQFSDDVYADSFGNSYAHVAGDGLKVLIEGHIDEIGLMITHIDDNGFLWFQPVGGWDPQVLIGQRVRILSAAGPVIGVVGRKAAHQLSADDRSKATMVDDMWIDIGARDGGDARSVVSTGDMAVIERSVAHLRDDTIAGRGLDNRVGAFIALEALRSLSSKRTHGKDVWAVAAAQEEIGQRGATTSAFSLTPDLAIVIDVSHATDHPEANVRGLGLRKIGGGAVLTRGSAVHPMLYEKLITVANEEGLPWMVEPKPTRTGTDADAISISRTGVPTALVKVPLRYMHSPNELASLRDIDTCIHLISQFVRSLEERSAFLRL